MLLPAKQPDLQDWSGDGQQRLGPLVLRVPARTPELLVPDEGLQGHRGPLGPAPFLQV